MATQASSAFGVQVKLSGTAIPEVRIVSDLGLTFNMIDVSAHDGLNGYGSSIPGLKRGKPLTIEYNLIPNSPSHIALRTAAENRASTPFAIVLPTSGNPTCTFNAFVGDIGIPTMAVDGALTGRAILTPDGPEVWT